MFKEKTPLTLPRILHVYPDVLQEGFVLEFSLNKSESYPRLKLYLLSEHFTMDLLFTPDSYSHLNLRSVMLQTNLSGPVFNKTCKTSNLLI